MQARTWYKFVDRVVDVEATVTFQCCFQLGFLQSETEEIMISLFHLSVVHRSVLFRFSSRSLQ